MSLTNHMPVETDGVKGTPQDGRQLRPSPHLNRRRDDGGFRPPEELLRDAQPSRFTLGTVSEAVWGRLRTTNCSFSINALVVNS